MRDAVVRSFWQGQISPYESLCLATFIAAGIDVEVFCEGAVDGLPEGVRRRNSREILDRDVSYYRHEPDGPSPALHSNHFRYALLERLGGWWIDADVMLTAKFLPNADIFVARQTDQELNVAVMRFPAGHPLMAAARGHTAGVLDHAHWGETGPRLLTALQPLYGADIVVAPQVTAYAIETEEFEKFFLPEAFEEVEERTKNSVFVHLWNEMWRRAGIPKTVAPPKGSWLDRMFERYHVPVVWSDRMEASYVERRAALRRERDRAALVAEQEILRLRKKVETLRRARFFGLDGVLKDLRVRFKKRTD
jgi:hypothetical protein